MNLVKILQQFYWINEYVICKFSSFDSKHNKIVLDRDFVIELAKLNNIIGRLELYINDRKDKENAVYMIEWFKKQMAEFDYDYDDFIEWVEEQNNSEK